MVSATTDPVVGRHRFLTFDYSTKLYFFANAWLHRYTRRCVNNLPKTASSHSGRTHSPSRGVTKRDCKGGCATAITLATCLYRYRN